MFWWLNYAIKPEALTTGQRLATYGYMPILFGQNYVCMPVCLHVCPHTHVTWSKQNIESLHRMNIDCLHKVIIVSTGRGCGRSLKPLNISIPMCCSMTET